VGVSAYLIRKEKPMSVTMLAPPQIGTLLGIWAHPDDEAYLSAGLMTQVRRSGGRVVVVTATRGEHGTDDPHRCPPDRVARVRERELHDSLDAVDVREHVWLGHPDGELGAMPRTVGVSQLVEILRLVRPDTIVTFGPGALWYATFTPDFHERWGSVNEQAGLWFEGTVPAVTPHAELAAQVRCTGDLLRTKHRALRAHSSQTRPLERLVGSDVYREWWATESFVAARRD